MTTVIKVNSRTCNKIFARLFTPQLVRWYLLRKRLHVISIMAKGRSFIPQERSKNHWFCAKPWSNSMKLHTRSTFKPVPSPPPGYQAKAKLQQTPYSQFPFSRHDNRNSFQDHGVYFGNGLGRRFYTQHQRNKCSDDLVPPRTTELKDSCYSSSFGFPHIDSAYTKDNQKYRRFSHNHWEKSTNTIERSPTQPELLKTTSIPHTTPLHVLAVTQAPFLRANTWVYSYKPKEYNRFLGP